MKSSDRNVAGEVRSNAALDPAWVDFRGRALEALSSSFRSLPEFRASLESPSYLSGLDGSAIALFAHAWRSERGGSSFWVVPSERDAEILFDDLSLLSGEGTVFAFPDTGVTPYEEVSPSSWIQHQRVRFLHAMRAGTPGNYVASAKAMARRMVTPADFSRLPATLTVSKEVRRPEVLRLLTDRGYLSVAQVENPGEFAKRGEIIDFFSPAHPRPVRLGFFDDEIEDLRFFDPATQRTVEKTASAVLLPLRECRMDEEDRRRILSERTSGWPAWLAERFREEPHWPGMEHWVHATHGNSSTLCDHVPASMTAFAVRPADLEKTAEIFHRETEEIEGSRKRKGRLCPPVDHVVSKSIWPKDRALLPLEGARHEPSSRGGVRFHLPAPPNFRAQLADFAAECTKRTAEGALTVLWSGSPEQVRRLGELLHECAPILRYENQEDAPAELPSKGLLILQGNWSGGVDLGTLRFVCDHELFGRKRRRHRSFVSGDPSRILESFVDLSEGDYVVHINHGIGLYRGLERRTVGGREKDYLLIEYAENSRLFIPVEQVNLIQKYIGSTARVSLDHLGGKAWEKVKQRVKKAVEAIAHELIRLYSARKNLAKTPYPTDTPWQLSFENAFEFEETPDQLAAVEAVKNDMQSPRPMDRLVCGDVGFGKTEVAVRAMFKAALAGRQTAMLVPTTILSDQHWHNLKRRFADYPIRVEVLNRFRSPKDQKLVIRELAEGKVDILIGTHRLLSKDVVFKDLGLLIIDEEQKFGVKHKEKIREVSRLVDTLTLSATPIPRTLHMSLVNIRDISVIATPPVDRLPVETYVTEFNEDLLIEAVNREMERGGQVYFVHNRVESIASVASYLQGLFPDLRVAIGHGQMEEHVLEDVMDRFIKAEVDLFVCTTIVDSGLDIANANTLFVNHAEDFGLSQLYQLRGRVGRSDRQAWAYFFYRKDRSLTEVAMKRLNTLADLVALGSGLKIALRDLEIRGAGNILGQEQSGEVMAVGFELYCQLLDDAVADLLPDGERHRTEALVDVKYEGFIPDEYLSEAKSKIELYKRISAIRSVGDKDAVLAEIRDRFGEPPPIVDRLLDLALLRIRATEAGIESVVERPDAIDLKMGATNRLSPAKLLALLSKEPDRFLVHPTEAHVLRIRIDNQNPVEFKQTPFDDKMALVERVMSAVE